MEPALPKKPLLLRALRGESIPRYPVWLMRQAGRYMPEYRALKEKHGFLKMCKTPELALEVSLQPVRFLDVDAAIVFSDILIPALAMGVELEFSPGPVIQNPIRGRNEVSALRVTDPRKHVPFVMETIAALRQQLGDTETPERKSVIGFAGTPWTVACYLIAQGPFKNFLGTQVFAKREREAFTSLILKLTEITCEYVIAQHESGADVIQLFDTWGGNLSLEDYQKLSLPSIKRIIAALRERNCPVILYTQNSHHLLSALAEAGADCVSIDSRVVFREANAIVGATTALQGNLDPTVLFEAPSAIAEKTNQMLRSVQRRSRYIANLGHGILPETPPDHVRRFVQTVKAFSLSQ